jgi:formylglycine-generating enzyme required for sulfatase activity
MTILTCDVRRPALPGREDCTGDRNATAALGPIGDCPGALTTGKYRNGFTKILLLTLCCLIVAANRSAAQDVQPGKTFRDCPDCPEMVVIPAGSFLMGSSEADTVRDFAAVPRSDNLGLLKAILQTPEGMAKKAMAREHPQHPVTIAKKFGLGVYPVTRREYSVFVKETGYSPRGGCTHFLLRGYSRASVSWQDPGFTQTDRDPVVCVGWQDAKAYVGWLNNKARNPGATGSDGPYRLPSEAEWEYAARAGTETARWWGDAIGTANANCRDCRNPSSIEGQTTPVDHFRPNPFGLYDMLGNVFEHTADCFHENYVGAPSDGHPWVDAHCSEVTFRGGDWGSDAWVLRSAHRSGSEKSTKANGNGFRIAKTLP